MPSLLKPPLTAHQRRRIQKADVDEIDRLRDQERYWNSEAVRALLQRAEVLGHESTSAGVLAARHVQDILDRLPDPTADLRALCQAVHASALRHDGQMAAALDLFTAALAIPGLTLDGESAVRQRMSLALVHAGRAEEGLHMAAETLRRQPTLMNRAVRAAILTMLGDFHTALQDYMEVLATCDLRSEKRIFMTSVANVAHILSYEAMSDVEEDVVARLLSALADCRSALPKAGSSYYAARRPRLMLARAEALLLVRARPPRLSRATSILRRVVDGLSDSYPDDALVASADLAWLYAGDGRTALAGKECQRTLELCEESKFSLKRSAVSVVKAAAERGSLSVSQAVEIRSLLRPV